VGWFPDPDLVRITRCSEYAGTDNNVIVAVVRLFPAFNLLLLAARRTFNRYTCHVLSEFIRQHRVHRFVTYSEGFSAVIVNH
jgi:hypothetical protein